MSNVVHCEICGAMIEKKSSKIVFVEGARLVLCPSCYSRINKKLTTEPLRMLPETKKATPANTQKSLRVREGVKEDFEVVEDFATRIRKAREALGWSQRVLAETVKESENVIKRLESGRLVPTIEQAKKLEKALNIKLLEPIVEGSEYVDNVKKIPKELTLGDIVNIKSDKK
ncbi:MAG: multiprotein bridging factor aMBF1 [Sulfolobales archaeon]|nr:multiprotein bridging factor aMBF1 [Sulfolobales archaeon]MDW7968970.1 multiprotein bridging factor aMBF1 [Sulfolobales archaeon]